MDSYLSQRYFSISELLRERIMLKYLCCIKDTCFFIDHYATNLLNAPVCVIKLKIRILVWNNENIYFQHNKNKNLKVIKERKKE